MIKSAEDIKIHLQNSTYHLTALQITRDICPKETYITAGFIRSLVWDAANNFRKPTVLNDLDLVYFDPDDLSEETDRALELKLRQIAPEYPWSVKNQARMHHRNNEAPYNDMNEALRRWCETVSPIGACLDNNDTIKLIHPLGLEDLLTGQCRATPHALSHPEKHQQYIDRMSAKAWDQIWPHVTLHDMQIK